MVAWESDRGAPTVVHGDHQVVFYEDDAFLIDTVGEYVAAALMSGDRAVAIATSSHLDAIRDALAERGWASAVEQGRFVAVDAAQLLDRFMVDGRPDEHAFTAAVEPLLEPASSGGRVRAFGEMVALLWERGDVDGAIRLEDLWNRLSTTHTFELLCAYPMGTFDSGQHAAFEAVCDRHNTVVPTERYTALTDPTQRQRVVASLQQEATAGAAERAALKREQAELEHALQQLRELDRQRGEFVAMVAHDIRSPLAVVSGYLKLLADNWSDLDQQEAAGFLDKAMGNARRVERLVDDFLTMSKIESGEFSCELRPVDLGRIVAEVVEQTCQTTGRDIRVRPADGLRAALADPDRQIQILTNLLSNATKYSPDDTPVTVTIADQDGQLTIAINDRGPGIAPTDHHKLFRPFSRLDNSHNDTTGTGLGLYIAKALVEQQGGTIQVDSTPATGTTFIYTVLAAGRAG